MRHLERALRTALPAALLLALSLATPSAAAAVPLVDTASRTQAQVRAEWATAMPAYAGTPFLVAPKIVAPYSTGTLQSGHVNDAIAKANFARYLTGLPDDVTVNATYAVQVQHSAVVLAAIGRGLTHTPAKPAAMPQAFFDLGLAGTKSSNLAAGRMPLHETVDMYLDDSDASNIALLGHRRWVLNPPMAKTGFGYAENPGSTFGAYSAMKAFDRSRTDAVAYKHYGWPSAGPFPLEFFSDGTAWSIHLDPKDYYDDRDGAGVVVTLTRVADREKWTFNNADASGASGSGEYFTFNGPGYGDPACIIFRPPTSMRYNPGDAFDVAVSGKLYRNGTATSIAISYRTTFFDLGASGPVARIEGHDRYDVAANVARKGWDPTGAQTWANVEHVIVANGEPGKEADPLTAAGLAGVYDAPVLLTQAGSLPEATRAIIAEIAAKNPGVKVHLIGGINSVPDARWDTIRRISGVWATKDRLEGTTRYDVSARIAKRIVDVKGAVAVTGVILIAADNPAAFYDALAAAPSAYARTMPMLAVMKGSVPASVDAVLKSAALAEKPRFAASSSTYIGGGSLSSAERMTESPNRYTAASQIADFAIRRNWVTAKNTGLAAKLPDAITGGAWLGKLGGVMLFTDSNSAIQPASRAFITASKAQITNGWVIGGTNSVPFTQETSFESLLN